MGRIYDATWGRGFSAIYDRAMKAAEEAGMREKRREVLAEAKGRTIDIGAGTGLNLDLFPSEVSELVLAEPDPHMLSSFVRKSLIRAGEPPSFRLRQKGSPLRTTASTRRSSPLSSARCPIPRPP